MSDAMTAPLLPSVTQKQDVMEYWWEVSDSALISPTTTSYVMGQHNKMGGNTFREALVNTRKFYSRMPCILHILSM